MRLMIRFAHVRPGAVQKQNTGYQLEDVYRKIKLSAIRIALRSFKFPVPEQENSKLLHVVISHSVP